MRPLPWVAMGLVVIVLTVPAHGYDLLADPVGWILVGYGASRLRLDESDRGRLVSVVWLAGLVSAATWPAPVAERLHDSDPSLSWAASLPQIGVAILICTATATLARRAGDGGAARWLDVTRTLSLIAAVLPVVVFGGGVDALSAATELVSVAAPLLLVVLSVRYAGRAWAGLRPSPATEPLSPDLSSE